MRFLLALSLVLVATAHGPRASACLSHYRSVESLVKSARSIVEVEVVSVHEAPPPGHHRDSPEARKDAEAKVRVLRVLRGKNLPKQWVVIGGPYASCDPSPEYLHFKTGQHFFLILSSGRSKPADPVVIRTVAQVFEGTSDAMERMIERGRQSWQRTFDLYQKADAKAYGQAESLLPKLADPVAEALASRMSYSVGACLNALAKDPERTPAGWAGNTGLLLNGVPMDVPPVDLDGRKGPEVIAFNRRILEILLADRYGSSASEIEKIAGTACIRDQLRRTGFDPERVRFSCQQRRDLQTLSFLQDLDRFEPDPRVFRLFAPPKEMDVDVAMVTRYLNRVPEREFDGRALGLLLNIAHPGLEGFADRTLAKAENPSELVDIFGFFVGIGRFEKAEMAVLGLKRALAKDGDAQAKAEWAQIHAESLNKIMTRHRCTDAKLRKAIAEVGRQTPP